MNYNEIIFSPHKFSEKYSAWIEHSPFAFFLIEKLQPNVFVELGTQFGASYFAFCQAISQLNINTKAYAVDSFTGDEHAGKFGQEVFNYVDKINNDHFSHFSNILKSSFDDANLLFENQSIDLLHIDGFHTYEAVKHDFGFWLPKMSEKGVIIFHDTMVKENNFGVWKLMDELRKQFPYFEFEHGHGLGVLCTGSNVNPEFLEFIKTTGKDSFTHKLFANLGKKIWLEQQHLHQKEVLEQQEITIWNNNQLIVFKEESNTKLRQTLESKNQHIVQINAQLKEITQILAAKENEVNHLHQNYRKLLDGIEKLSTTKNRSEIDSAIEQGTFLSDDDEIIKYQNYLNNLRLKIDSQAQEIHQLTAILTRITKSPSWKLTAPLRFSKRLIKNNYFILLPKLRLIEKCRLFDSDYYLQNNPDVVQSKIDTAKHYLLYGGFEGRNPSEKFDSAFYLEQNPDVRTSGMNPLLHYVLHGQKENRLTIPLLK